MPEGAVLAEVHVERDVQHTPGPVLVMRKLSSRAGDWAFVYADSRLRALRRGPLADCAECHATAGHDGVFIVRR